VRIRYAAELADETLIAEAAACVEQGGTIIFPTETVYGIGAAPENDRGIAAVFAAKGRSVEKPLALHVADAEQARPFVAHWPDAALRAIAHFWPGPLAIILPRAPHRFVKAAAGYETISLRCPDQTFARQLFARTGPLAATSANRSGHPAFRGSPEDIGDLPAATLAIVAGPTLLQRESTIMDCSGELPRVLRWGAVERAALEAVMGTVEPRL